MGYSVIDNFLDKDDFKALQDVMTGNDFPWFYGNTKTYIDPKLKDQKINQDYNFQFTHYFYRDYSPSSGYWPILNKFNEFLNPLAYTRIKANLTVKTPEIITYGYHTDYLGVPSGLKTAVYYINTNNGKTIFKDGDEVDSIENRLVVFDTDMLHTGTSCTDQNTRILLNINFFPSQ
jgi:hypothetical protein